nr:hypothetical protein [Tanacetum cinerariifolium]
MALKKKLTNSSSQVDSKLGIHYWPELQKGFYKTRKASITRGGVYSNSKIVTVTHVEVERKYDYGFLIRIDVKRADGEIYTFKESDYSRLSLNDIQDLYLPKVQGIDEVFKFGDGTTIKIKEELETMLGENKIGYKHGCLKVRVWTTKDIKRSKRMLNEIKSILKARNQKRCLESYVEGRPKTRDLRLFVRPECSPLRILLGIKKVSVTPGLDSRSSFVCFVVILYGLNPWTNHGRPQVVHLGEHEYPPTLGWITLRVSMTFGARYGRHLRRGSTPGVARSRGKDRESSIRQDWRVSAPKDEMPAKDTYSLEAVAVKINTRPRAAHEVLLLTVTTSRVIEMEDPDTITDSSGVPSTIERSPLDFANENPSQQSTREHRKKRNDEVDANAPPKVLRKYHADSRPTQSTIRGKSLASMGLGTGSTFPVPTPQETPAYVSDLDPLLFANPHSIPKENVAQSSKGAAITGDPELKNTSFTSMVGSPESICQPE